MSVRNWIALAAVLCTVALPGYAVADISRAALLRAVAAKERAIDHGDAANWLEAYDRFLEADAVEHSPVTKYELGFAAMRLGHDDLAYGHYEDAIALGLDGPALGEARSFLTSRAPVMALLTIDGPDGLIVRIRNMDRGRLPLRKVITVLAGEAKVELLDPVRGSVSRRRIALSAQRVTLLDLRDEDPVARRPPTKSETIKPPSGDARRADVATTKTPPRSRRHESQVARPMLGLGLGLVLAGATAVPVSMSMLASKRDQLSRACEELVSDQNGCVATKEGKYAVAKGAASGIARWRTGQAVGWAAIGAGAALATLGWLLDSDTVRVSIIPGADLHAASVHCFGQF